MSNLERMLTLKRAKDDFPYFTHAIFSQSTDILKSGAWTDGEFIEDICRWLVVNKKTIRVSAKDHFKSMSFYAHIMWKILRLYFTNMSREIQYFSYKDSMSSYHLAKIKVAVMCNPFFRGVVDSKEQAEGIISYTWNGEKKLTVSPKGLLEFKRGIHCPDIYVDDAMQDPENKMILTKINRINQIMRNQIIDMAQDELHIVGTAQTNNDFYFDRNFTSRFAVRIMPAIINDAEKRVLWPEWMDYAELMAKKLERGEKVFNQEYLVSPVYSENAYFDREKLGRSINKSLKNYSTEQWEREMERRKNNDEETDTDRVGGWDLGKKSHPAHFTWFEKINKKRIQRHSKWFDNVDYTEQLEYIKTIIDACSLHTVYYDATRGELEMQAETGELPGELEPVHFTFKGKNSMANAWDKAITNGAIEILNDQRMIDQILIVNNDLQAPDTPEGHGDSFWSIALTFRDAEMEGVDITFM